MPKQPTVPPNTTKRPAPVKTTGPAKPQAAVTEFTDAVGNTIKVGDSVVCSPSVVVPGAPLLILGTVIALTAKTVRVQTPDPYRPGQTITSDRQQSSVSKAVLETSQ